MAKPQSARLMRGPLAGRVLARCSQLQRSVRRDLGLSGLIGLAPECWWLDVGLASSHLVQTLCRVWSSGGASVCWAARWCARPVPRENRHVRST